MLKALSTTLATLLLLFFPASSHAAPQFVFAPNSVYEAQVERVVDGDTAILLFPMEGRKRPWSERIRFIGVNTPETVDPKRPVQSYGKEASAFTKKELSGRTVWLQTDVGIRDRHKRILGYIWLSKPKDLNDEQEIRENMFNAILLRDGYAQTMTVQPNSRYVDLFIQIEREAREAKKGLWK